MDNDRLTQQLAFILELDKLKEILRQSRLINSRRQENSAEHSWHVALMAMVLAEYANEPVDATHVMKLMLVHDIVEIDADDTFLYDDTGREDKLEREQRAADRLFGMLPDDQGAEFRQLWDEYEQGDSAEVRFARALDRVMPLMHNYYTQGTAWQAHNLRVSQVMDKNSHIEAGSEVLWEKARSLIEDAVDKGYLNQG
ncbi:MAG: HD domain-containing protein [Pseudomonadota bacterium]